MFKSISVVFPNSSSSPGIVASYNIRQNRYEHDIISIVFRNWDTQESAVKPGSPMIVTLTNGESEKTIYCYVHHFSRKRRADADHTEVVGIGSSFVLKQARQKVYVNTTASEVAKKIAKKHKLAYNIAPHPRVYPQISQAGMTDWQLLVKLAKQCGYTLRVDDMILHFKPVDEEYEFDRTKAPKFFMSSMGTPTKPSIYSFKPLVGDILHYEDVQKAATAVSGSDPRSSTPHSVTSKQKKQKIRKKGQPEIFDRFKTSVVAPNYQVAKHEAEAIVELNRFPYRAKAILKGSPTVRPDMPIYLDGLGEDFNGYWVVLSTEHKMEDFTYTTEVVVGVDSTGPSIYAAPPNKQISDKLFGSTTVSSTSRVRAALGVEDVVLESANVPVFPDYSVSVTKVANLAESGIDTPQASLGSLGTSLWKSTRSDVRAARVDV